MPKGAAVLTNLTKRSRVLGLPVGRRRTDWVKVARAGAAGLSAVATFAGGVGAKRMGGKAKPDGEQGETAEPARRSGPIAKVGEKVGEKAGSAASQAASGVVTPIRKVASQVSELPRRGGKRRRGDRKGGDRNLKRLRLIIRESIDVGVPLRTAYNQWTQFAQFPSIMKGVAGVEQEADDVTSWTAKIGPASRRWRAEITEQVPDERIAWQSTDGTENRGAVTFHRLDRNLTRIQLEMEYFPRGFLEKAGNLFLVVRRQVRRDLRLAKHYLELSGSETGAWRGEIAKDDTDREEEPSGGQKGQGRAGSARPARRSTRKRSAGESGATRSTRPAKGRKQGSKSE